MARFDSGSCAIGWALFIVASPRSPSIPGVVWWVNGLAISLVFGILVSTVLTLVVIPLLYYVAYRHKHPAPEASAAGATA